MEEDATLEENPEDSELNGEDKEKMELPVDMYYKYDELHSRPYITPCSDVAENLLHFSHSFGYDSKRRANLQLLDNEILIFIAGNILVLLDMSTKEQRYLRSCSGGGIGCIMVHPSKMYFAAGEKGNQPNIIVYEYPSLQPYRILRGGTERAYSYVDFNCDGTLLASIGSAPDYMLVLWDWRQEQVMMRSKAVSQDVYRVSFSPYNKELLTSSGSGHIKFWKIASSFTGPKLQGFMGNFGLTPATDIEGFMELPDGKVLSGTNWGNLLLWDRRDIKVEFCRKGGQTCHTGTIQPFALEDGQLFTIGSDGVVRCWDFEMVSSADSHGDNRYCELEPLNELVVGRNVCLSSMVKSFLPDSIWFAQDSNGAIWKLDLSFTNTTIDPECLFSFPTGPIQGLDVSKKSHLMATTTLDHSVKVFDFLENRELTTLRFNQGGTALIWAPLLVNPNGCLLVSGFEDGVVRLLELYNPQKLHVDTGRSPTEDAKLLLKQAFKPHDAAVTALAYERNGEILATGSADCTVFFLSTGKQYEPIGFIHVPGTVQALEWSPHSHHNNRLLILCQNGHVVEVPRPESKAQQPTKTFQLFDLPRRSFRFRSIKSHIKREEEIARRKAIKEKKKKEKEEQLKESETPDAENEKEELPPIYIPDPPSPLCCGFYSEPGQFWLSMGGFDSGYLYHCKFSEKQNEDPEKQLDEPFDFLPVHNADDDPIQHITFSSSRKRLLCGMSSGSIRVYHLQPDDRSITSMKAYWSLSVHDNDYGHLRHICCSHDNYFVLTAGDDGNIFSFSLLPPEELQNRLQKKRAKVPLPRVGLETETPAQDIEDPAALCMETAKQKLHKDYLRQAAEFKHHEKSRKLAEVQKKYDEVLKLNQSLPEYVRLQSEELQLDPGFYEHIEKMKADQLMEVRKQLAWEQEHSSLAFNKLLDWFRNFPETSVVTVVAIRTNLRVSTYSMLVFSKTSDQQSRPGSPDGDRDVLPELSKSQTCKKQQLQADDDKTEEEEVPPPPETKPRIKLGRCHMERLKREAERAEQARAKIEKRKQEWAQLYAEKPDENYEDPQDVQAIRADQENIADLKRESDVTVTTNLRTLAERKREELTALRENIHIKHMEMNRRIMALRDSKLRLVSWLHAQTHQLQKIQECLPRHLHLSPLTLPNILPEETPEKWLQCKLIDLDRYLTLREQRRRKGMKETEEDICLTTCKIATLLEHMKKEIGLEEEKAKSSKLCDSSVIIEEKQEEVVSEAADLSELEKELQKEQEIRLLFEQDSLLKKMESAVSEFDMELLLLHNQKLRLDFQTKLADLCQLTFSQEIQLINQFKRREGSLQENLNKCIMEENRLRSEQEKCKDQLKLKQKEIARLHEKEKGLLASLQKALAEDNTFEQFLIKVFKKKIKRVKIKEQTGDKEQEEESDEESDEDDWDNDDDFDDFGSTLEMEAVVDDSVCPSGCNEELFDYVLKLRENRLELEDHVSEEKKSAEALKGECEALIKKERVVKSSRKAVEHDLELVNREIQEKMNQLDVVVPLRLHQIQCASGGGLPSGRTELLVHNSTQNKLKQRITELHMETNHQGDLHSQSEQQHAKLICSHSSMALEIQELEMQCSELMITKFGKLVDLDALQLQSGNRKLEELKQEKLLKEAEYDNQLKNLEAKEEQARDYLHEVTKRNTELLRTMTSLTDEKIKLSHKFKARQNFIGKTQYLDRRRRETQDDILRLEEMEKRQSQQMKILKREIDLLSGKASKVKCSLPTLKDTNPGNKSKDAPQKCTHSAGKQKINKADCL